MNERPPWVEPGFRIEPEFEPHMPADSTPPRQAARRPTRGRLPILQEENLHQPGTGAHHPGTTPEQRAHWRALCTAATLYAPFPWSPGPGNNDGLVRSAGGLVIADCKGHEARTEYIALAAQLVPLLLDEIEQIEADRMRLRATVHEVLQGLRLATEVLSEARAVGR